MNLSFDLVGFRRLAGEFNPSADATARSLALYSAAVAVADEDILSQAVAVAKRSGLTKEALYEVVLQSYLFLGFPRMLSAAENLNSHFRDVGGKPQFEGISDEESKSWFLNGLSLCRQVYGPDFPPLQSKVEAFAPEIFRWMIVEGYGKVLSRPGLSISDRELSIIAFLLVESRPKQLFSHIKGALNVGVPSGLVRAVVNDLGPVVGPGFDGAKRMLEQLGIDR